MLRPDLPPGAADALAMWAVFPQEKGGSIALQGHTRYLVADVLATLALGFKYHVQRFRFGALACRLPAVSGTQLVVEYAVSTPKQIRFAHRQAPSVDTFLQSGRP